MIVHATMRGHRIIAVTMLMSVITLANLMDLRYAEFPGEQLLENGRPVSSITSRARTVRRALPGSQPIAYCLLCEACTRVDPGLRSTINAAAMGQGAS